MGSLGNTNMTSQAILLSISAFTTLRVLANSTNDKILLLLCCRPICPQIDA